MTALITCFFDLLPRHRGKIATLAAGTLGLPLVLLGCVLGLAGVVLAIITGGVFLLAWASLWPVGRLQKAFGRYLDELNREVDFHR